MSAKSEEECLEAFRNVETLDEDKTISLEDLEVLLQQLGFNPTSEEIYKDVEEGARVDEEKFLEYVRAQASDPYAELREAFNAFDADNSGFIDKKELKDILLGGSSKFTDEDVQGLFEDADKNQDEKLDIEEFVHLLLGGGMNGPPVQQNEEQAEETQAEQ